MPSWVAVPPPASAMARLPVPPLVSVIWMPSPEFFKEAWSLNAGVRIDFVDDVLDGARAGELMVRTSPLRSVKVTVPSGRPEPPLRVESRVVSMPARMAWSR